MLTGAGDRRQTVDERLGRPRDDRLAHLAKESQPRAAKPQQDARRRSGWVSRELRLLRAHGPITKVTRLLRYQLSQPQVKRPLPPS